MTEPLLQIDGLTKRFGAFTAVDHVSFRIAKGEIFGFLGSNGCGKSTTMKMLTGLLPISEGKAFLFGQSVDGQDIETRRNVGYMSQAFSLYSELTVRQNLELHTKLFDLPEAEQGQRVEEMLDRFGLRGVADSNPEDLPLGVRQRLQLAVAVQHRPKMLIIDEPTSGVDPVARDQFWEYLIDLSRKDGVTIFLSTHFMNEAERCDRISLMNAGKVLAVGTPRSLTEARHAKTLEEAFIGYLEDAIAAAERIAGVADSKVIEYKRPLDLAEGEERKQRIRDSVDKLPDFLKQVIILAYYQGLKYREVAEILEIPVGTVKSRLHAALIKLQEAWSASPSLRES